MCIHVCVCKAECGVGCLILLKKCVSLRELISYTKNAELKNMFLQRKPGGLTGLSY